MHDCLSVSPPGTCTLWIPPWSSRCSWLQLPHNIAGEKWCLSMDEYLFTSSVHLKGTVYMYLHAWRSLRPQRFVTAPALFYILAHQFTAKYSSDFNFSDAAWWLVMQHAGVCYPSESRAESTKEKASSGYILLSSHTAWSRLQLGWGGFSCNLLSQSSVFAIRQIVKIQKMEMLR